MIRSASVAAAALLAFALSVHAKTFSLSVQKGGAEIVRSETGEQVPVADSGVVNVKDMVSLADGQQATLAVEANAALLLRGPATLSLVESGNTLTVLLDDGQVLLIRKQPYGYSSVAITARGFVFTPMGTVAAIKTSSDAPPTTAVVEGKMRMQNPGGEALVIDQGNFGNVGANGKLATGALSPRAMESLKEWQASAPAVFATAPAAASTGTAPAPSPSTSGPKAASPSVNASSASTAPAVATDEKQSSPPASTESAASVAGTGSSPEATASDKAPAAAPDKKAEKPDEKKAAAAPQDAAKPSAEKVEKTPPPPSSPKWEISAGTVTVDNEQWARLALGFDLPLWKFGIFFDVELFIDNDGQFSNKGWNFQDDWIDALTRKIRYVRFGQEGEPLFIKFGGLSSVTMGYGFLVDRFTNMLNYPDEKLLGLQFDLNDLSPIGVTLQTLVADFRDFDNDGGLVAARLALRPLKPTGIPILKGISIGGSYAVDLNQFAPARKWDYTMTGSVYDRDEDGIQDSSSVRSTVATGGYTFTNDARRRYIAADMYDTVIEHRDQWASREEDPFGLIGGDVGVPIISTSLVGLDVYGQAGIRDDNRHGWGIGAPGVALKVWRIWTNVEYRRVQGAFQPGYFGRYYLDERISRNPEIITKEQRLFDDTLNGVFGRLGVNIADVLLIEGSYQYMAGQQDTSVDQRFEAIGSLGELLLEKIPKLNRAEVYFNKSRIGVEDDEFFEKTPFMYFGYRAGFEIAAGASLIFDARYGYKRDKNGKLIPDNNIGVQTAISF